MGEQKWYQVLWNWLWGGIVRFVMHRIFGKMHDVEDGWISKRKYYRRKMFREGPPDPMEETQIMIDHHYGSIEGLINDEPEE